VIRSAIAALFLLFALLGCAPGRAPLVTVGSQTVTVDDYERASRGVQNRYDDAPGGARTQLVNDLERRAVMLELAHRLGQDRAPEILITTHRNEERALLQMLYARAAPQAQRVSEAEAVALYDARNEEAELHMIYTSSRRSALAAQARILAGEPFEGVSQSFSLPGLLPPDGNLGFVAPGSLPDPLDHAMRTQAVGEIGGPYSTREGWFVVKVARRQPRAQGSYAALRAGMYDLMRQRKQRAAFTRVYQQLQREYAVTLVPGGAQLLFRVTSALEPLTPTEGQKQEPIARYQGGVYTLQDAINDLSDADAQRPQFQLLPALEIWIEAQAMTRVSVLEARRRHLHEEPEFVATIRLQREEQLLQGVYQDAVAGVPPPGPDLVRSAWERVQPQYTRLESVQLAVLETPDSSLALRVAMRGRPGLPLADAVNAVEPSLTVSQTTVPYPNDDPAWSAMQALFTQMQTGAWFGPEPTPNGYRIIQLVNKTLSGQEFEQLPEGLRQNIIASAADLAREGRFQDFTDSLAREYKPVVRRDLVARLPWPVLPPLDVGR
jgi:parvulin-like peptidyl-prolyl isomerase